MGTNKVPTSINVAHINSAWGKGGAAQLMQDLSGKLSELDSKVFPFFIVGRNYSSKQEVINVLTTSEFLTNVLYTRITGVDCFGLPFTKRNKFQEILTKCDLIHLHNLHGYYFNLNDLELFKGFPIVWTIHDFWINTARVCYYDEAIFNYQTGKFPSLSEYPKTLFINRGMSVSKKKRDLIKSFAKNITFIAVSEYTKNEIQKVYPDVNIHKIYNGIDIDTFKYNNNDKCKRNKFNIVILAANYKDKRKGIENFYKAISLMGSSIFASNIQVDMVGDLHIPDKYNHLLNYYDIMLHGYVKEREKVAKILSKANLFVNLSSNETFCLANVEAMACGTPLLILNNPINKEIVGDVGIYAENSDPRNIADILLNIINHKITLPNPEIVRDRGKRFDLTKTAQDYLELYQHVMYNYKKRYN